MTYLEIVNEVLKRLRQPTVTTVDADEYTVLIAALVNEAKREVENAWDWSMLRTAVPVTTTATTSSYALTGTNVRTRLLDAWNTTKKIQLLQVKNNEYINKQTNIANVASTSPIYFDMDGVNASRELKVRVWPTPDAEETLTFYTVIPQAELSSEADVLSVPSDPVVQGAYLRAINERGEDQGRLSEIQAMIFQNSISAHIAIDANKFSDELTWRPI